MTDTTSALIMACSLVWFLRPVYYAMVCDVIDCKIAHRQQLCNWCKHPSNILASGEVVVVCYC